MSDNIINGVHGCSEADNYITPKDPLVIKKLEEFQDRKLGFMMHWAPVTQLGIVESWAMVDADGEWSQKEIDWTDDMDEFRLEYRELYKSFNPVRFQPDRWAKIAKECGFKYLLFTTKHHDGFCMWDTKTTDYKITSENCPFSRNKNSDIVRNLYDSFRREGLGIHTYFSKSDWDCPYYWHKDFEFKDGKTTRNPNYDTKEHPDIWEDFVRYTHKQITELMTDYGAIDCLWLDGGQVNPEFGQDIRLGELVEQIRATTQPGLISADRTVGGAYENFITPEQSIPEKPIFVPWESCITLGETFSYKYESDYKSPREIIHILIDIVAKGGNLALNITPQPDGRLPERGVKILRELGNFLQINGEAVYATRVCAPYVQGKYAFTKKEDKIYVFYLYEENEKPKSKFVIPYNFSGYKAASLNDSKISACDFSENNTIVNIEQNDIKMTPYAKVFCFYL